MGILNIQPATLKGAHLLIQVFGGPQSGKTRTALRLARGMAGPKGKVGVIDTESGRARLHANKIPGGFFTGELTPPFTPARYRLAIEEMLAAKVDVLVIDSWSHVWSGTGGVLEMADLAEKGGAKGQQIWLRPKVEYRKLIAFLLSTRMHIILSTRAKQPLIEGVANGKKTLTPGPWEPISDKMFRYEMTVSIPMLLAGTYETSLDRLKSHEDLVQFFDGKLLTEETGARIAELVDDGVELNHDHELLKKRAADAAQDGVEAFREFWKAASKADREVLRGMLENLESVAKAADEMNELHKVGGAGTISEDQQGEDDKPAADPFAGRKEPETKDETPPPQHTGRFPAPPAAGGDWTDWMHAAKKLADEAAGQTDLAQIDDEFRKIAGIPDVVHGTVARAIRDRGKTLKGK